ncbi:hypothetical protein ACGFSB_29000 [Streptomyces sp. NPDC048441]|uniref:hypothetical protein n=1 Tax=Streptomyces sp. NPDC048441 TaxID=3365552 RepID=UPI00371F7AEC
MSDVQPEPAGVQAQYAARVAVDLETNRQEQERVGAEVAALQEQLQALENDHAVLLSMKQALGSTGTAAAVAKKESTRASTREKAVPAPRASAKDSDAARTKKPTKSSPATAAKKPAAPAAGPTLVELIDNHLGRQIEPRSAAEITAALAEDRPGRTIKTTVVRTTVEGLVAKGRAQRTKQGSSVFYTSASPAEKAAAPQPEADAKFR